MDASDASSSLRRSPLGAWLARAHGAAIVLLAVWLVFLARIIWVGAYGSRLAFWDEIPAELVENAKRPGGGIPSLEELTRPHNEHRIFWQRLLAFGLLRGNDSTWDSVLRCQANAGLAALAALVLAFALRGKHRGWTGVALFAPALVLTALPIAYANLLFGFQSSFYLQLFLSFAALTALTADPPWRAAWWAGLLCGLAAIFTSGSGFFTAPVLVGWAGLCWLRGNRMAGRPLIGMPRADQWLALIPMLVAAGIILVPGLWLIHRPANAAPQQAGNIGEFAQCLLQHMAWPFPAVSALAPLIWAPSAVLGWLVIAGCGDSRWIGSARAALLVAGWVLLNLLAMSYARGAGAFPPLPRYVDFHVAGLAANGAALVLVWLEADAASRGVRRRTVAFASLAWAALSATGAAGLARQAWAVEMPEISAFRQLQADNVARFTSAGEEDALDGYFSRFHLPYPDAEELREWLSDPEVVARLPSNFRPPSQVGIPSEVSGTCALADLPPGVRPPPGERHWISSFHRGGDQQGTYRGAVITPSGEFLRLWYLGMPTGGAVKLHLKPEGKGKRVPVVSTRRHGTSVWQPLTLRVVPGRAYRVEFSDRSDTGWGAFTQPVDEPPLSRYSQDLSAAAPGWFVGAAALLAALAAWRPRAVWPPS